MSGLSVDQIIRLIETLGGDGRQQLAEADVPDKIPKLCAALEQASSAHVRHVLCNLLASLEDPLALPCLLRALHDEEPDVIAAAADAVGNCAYDRPVAEPLPGELGSRLLTLMTGSEWEAAVRTSAIYALGLMRFAPALPQLEAALEDETPSIRWSAAEALAHLGDPAAIPALRRRYEREPHERVRSVIEEALDTLVERE